MEEEDQDDYEDDLEETEEDEDDEQALMEQEGEFNDTLRIEGVLTGEEWLTSQFLLSNNDAMAQTVTISKKIKEDNREKLNKSDISNNRRPISPFGTQPGDNAFSITKMGYAYPANLDRSLPSALKKRDKIPRTPADPSDPNWKENFEPERAFNLEYYLNKEGRPAEGRLDSGQADKHAQLHGKIAMWQ